jgi:hypothetical protein
LLCNIAFLAALGLESKGAELFSTAGLDSGEWGDFFLLFLFLRWAMARPKHLSYQETEITADWSCKIKKKEAAAPGDDLFPSLRCQPATQPAVYP